MTPFLANLAPRNPIQHNIMDIRKTLILPLLLISVLGAGQCPSYRCCRTSSRIKVDGRLNERDWKSAPESSPFLDIRGEGQPLPTMKSCMKMLHDDDFVYIAGIIEEKDIKASLKERDAVIWKDNDFEVFIDPYGDGKLYYEFETNAFGTIMDLMLEKPYRDGGSFLLNWDCRGIALAVRCDGTLNKSSDTDRGWTVEIAIPYDALTRNFDDPRDHKVWRMNFSRVEWLVAGGPEENWVWAPTGVVDIHIPEKWGYVEFVD